MATTDDVNSTARRIGRAVVRVHQARRHIPDEIKAKLGALLATGNAMDFISRVHGYTQSSTPLTAEAIIMFAQAAGIPEFMLIGSFLPALKNANIADHSVKDRKLVGVQEFLGVTGTLVEQSARLFDEFAPSNQERAMLHSVEIGAFAPLVQQQHLDQLRARGFSDEDAEGGYKLSLAAGVNKRIKSTQLNEQVVYNPYVWQTQELEIAKFLRNLPPNERDLLLGLTEQASQRQGLAIGQLQLPDAGVFNAARKVGLIQSATVKSSGGSGRSQTYVFSPTNDRDDDAMLTSEALHMRKLFVAHILFGNELAASQGGQIRDPVVLVNALVNRGSVGPATNIGTDYHLVEAAGIVRVDKSDSGRAYLKLVNREIVEGGLGWLRSATSNADRAAEVKLLRSPGGFANPEDDARSASDDDAAMEVSNAAILKLREELQSGARQDSPFDRR